MSKMAFIRNKVKRPVRAIGIAVSVALTLLVNPIVGLGDDASQVSIVIVPSSLAFPLLPAMTVIPNAPATNREIIIGLQPLSNGLVGIVRLSGSF